MTTKTKRSQSALFSTIQELESDDHKAAKKRKKIASQSISKSKTARSQNNLYTGLMEIRILLQRALYATKTTNATTTKSNNEKDDDTHTSNIETVCQELWNHLSDSRTKLCHTTNKNETNSNMNIHESNDESKIQSSYESCREMWKNVLNKRHEDLQIHTGLAMKASKKFQFIDQSFWNQVTSTLSHDHIMNQANAKLPHQSSSTNIKTTETAFSLFKDDKLYQNMLKDFITLSSSSSNLDPNENQRLLKAMKKSKNNQKNVDRKASKGRKIRYVIHPKLTNFTFPIQRPVPLINEDDWFKSLFGGSTLKSKTFK